MRIIQHSITFLMKKLFVFLCFIGFIQLAAGQNFTHEFGKFSGEEFKYTQYPKDPSAEAVVIYDIGNSFFTESGDELSIVFERKMKFKIFSKAGLKWAQIAIPFYEESNKFEEIYDLKGNTYNFENGTVRTSVLNIKTAYDEKINEHWREKKFAMPDVKEGSVFEVSYKIRTPYLFNFRSWEFQRKIPVLYSEYVTHMIPFYEYTYILQGTNKFDDYSTTEDRLNEQHYAGVTYHDMIYKFVMKDIPAFKDEAFITSDDDYLIKLDFQLAVLHYPTGGVRQIMNTWPKMCEDMLDEDSFGKFVNSAKKKAKEIVDPMQLAAKSPKEKARIIDAYMKQNFRWNGHSDKVSTKSVKDFMNTKTGNSGDINLFMAGMLNAAGVEAYPVILSTRDHGKLKLDYPFHHFFNYVIVVAKTDSGLVMMDATEPLCKFSEVPQRCLNDKGLIIQKNKVEWLNLKSTTYTKKEYNYTLQPNAAKDSLSEDCKLVTTGYEAIDYRGEFTNSYKDLKKNLLGDNALESDMLTPANLKEIDKPFEIGFKKKEALDIVENKLIIAPFCNMVITENPLKQVTRTFPIDMIYPKTSKFLSTIIIPKGYKLLSKPEDMSINTNKIRIFYMVDTKDDDVVKVVGIYEFKQDVYQVEDYMNLKSYFNMIVSKFNEKLVLVKM